MLFNLTQWAFNVTLLGQYALMLNLMHFVSDKGGFDGFLNCLFF